MVWQRASGLCVAHASFALHLIRSVSIAVLKSTFLKQWPFLDGFSWYCRSLLVRLQRCALQTCFLFRRKLMAGIRQMLNPAPKRVCPCFLQKMVHTSVEL
jgi:hypothetical protein